MKIIPETKTLVVITDGVVSRSPLTPAFKARDHIIDALAVNLEMGKTLPNGPYILTVEWRLIKGVNWKLERIW